MLSGKGTDSIGSPVTGYKPDMARRYDIQENNLKTA